MSSKIFAAQYPRDSSGLILFPRDSEYRQQLFPKLVKHPAKNNLFMIDAIIDYITTVGDTILDPMAGTGSLMIAASKVRRVILIELEEPFVDNIRLHKNRFGDNITVIQGDCRKVLPLGHSVDAVIFSPPYGQTLNRGNLDELEDDLAAGTPKANNYRSWARWSYGVADFSRHPDNIARLSEFWQWLALEDIYNKCAATLKPGGILTLITKDHYLKDERVPWALMHHRRCIKAGLVPIDWFKREAVGMYFGRFLLSKGVKQVVEEDIMMFRKPS